MPSAVLKRGESYNPSRQHRTIRLRHLLENSLTCISSRSQIKDLDAHLSTSAKKCLYQNPNFLRICSCRIMRCCLKQTWKKAGTWYLPFSFDCAIMPYACRVGISVLLQLPKLARRVRLPYPAPKTETVRKDGFCFCIPAGVEPEGSWQGAGGALQPEAASAAADLLRVRRTQYRLGPFLFLKGGLAGPPFCCNAAGLRASKRLTRLHILSMINQINIGRSG